MAVERTLALLKPDAFQRELHTEILARINQAGFTLVKTQHLAPGSAKMLDHYWEHRDKEFFNGLIDFMTAGPSMALILEGEDAIARWRDLIGPYYPRIPGTIRGDLMRKGDPDVANLVHASDGHEAAAREIALWFPEEREKGTAHGQAQAQD